MGTLPYNPSGIDPRDDPVHPFTPDEWSQQCSGPV